MSNFLAGIGSALIHGGQKIGAWREEDRQADLQRQQAEMQKLQMALMRRDQELQERAFEGAEQDRARTFARTVLQDAGPEGFLDETAASAVTAGGFGHRLGQQQDATISSTQFGPSAYGTGFDMTPSPGHAAGRAVVPTSAEQIALTERDVKARAMRALDDPRFWSLPPERRQSIWLQAGNTGPAPTSEDERFNEAKRVADYQHRQRMEELNAQLRARNLFGTPQYVVRNGQIVNVRGPEDILPTDQPFIKPTGTGPAARGQSDAANFGQFRARNIREAIKRLRGDTTDENGNVIPGDRINRSVVGLGSLTDWVTESPALEFAQEVEGLRANIIQKSLQEMRDASKTGGALGQVSDFENRLLALTMGPLNTRVRPETFKQQLDIIEDTLIWWEQQKAMHPEEAAQIDPSYAAPAPGPMSSHAPAPGGAPAPGARPPAKKKFVIVQ